MEVMISDILQSSIRSSESDIFKTQMNRKYHFTKYTKDRGVENVIY